MENKEIIKILKGKIKDEAQLETIVGEIKAQYDGSIEAEVKKHNEELEAKLEEVNAQIEAKEKENEEAIAKFKKEQEEAIAKIEEEYNEKLNVKVDKPLETEQEKYIYFDPTNPVPVNKGEDK